MKVLVNFLPSSESCIYTIKIRLPSGRFLIDNKFQDVNEARMRLNKLSNCLPPGTSLYLYQDDVWIENQYTHPILKEKDNKL
jgi:hypothetical protein